VTSLSPLQSSAWTDHIGDIIMQLIQFPLQQHWLFLTTRVRNVNQHHLVQCKCETDETVGNEEKLDNINRLKKG